MLGTTRPGLTQMARSGGVVDRPLASGERGLAESHWHRRGVSQTRVARLRQPLGRRLSLGAARWAAVESPRSPTGRGRLPGVPKWHDHSGDPARGVSLVGHHGALIGLGAAWGVGSRCWPVLARWLPGQLNPLGLVAGPAGVPRVDVWAVVRALVCALRPDVGTPPWRVVADADLRPASFRNPLVAEGRLVSSRRRQEAVGGDDPGPVVGQRPRGRPRQPGRVWKLATVLKVEPRTALTVRLDGQEEHRPVVWRDGWGRALTHQVRGVVGATTQEPILWVSTDLTRPPEAIIQLAAARLPRELTRRALKQYGGLGDDQGSTRLAIPRFVPLAVTACCGWRLSRRQAQQAPWLTTAPASPAGQLSPLRCQRRHRALRPFVLPRMVAASAPGADCPKPAGSDEPIVRIAA